MDDCDEPGLRHERIAAAGVTLHVVRAGEGPPVLLLHGFPETWRSWRRQIRPLVAAGFAVLAPDLRGYNLSDRPSGREAYQLRHLVADVAALVRTTGWPRAHLVGHDWGGLIAWSFTGEHPELVDKLVLLNAPHMGIYLRKVWRPPQLLRSWYLLLFLLPGVAEWILSARDFRVVRDMFARSPARPGAFPDEDIDQCIRALARPGALTAALNYYRANLGSDALAQARAVRTDVPTLVIWGERDPALGTALLDGLERFASRVQIHRIPDASHWVQNEAPDEVNRVLIGFLTAESTGTAVSPSASTPVGGARWSAPTASGAFILKDVFLLGKDVFLLGAAMWSANEAVAAAVARRRLASSDTLARV